MGLKYKRSDIEGQARALAKASSEFKGMIAAEMQSISPAIKNSMIFHSDLRKNRISGNMVGAMDVEVSKTALQLRFGFINQVRDYYQYQTITGFTHWGSGRFIEPSLALEDAKEDATILMEEASRRVMRNFAARVRRRG